ncbi:MAG: hypothetical protein CM15mP49_20580 [Actinomycetota bacterium]|nr:MAG: hypothetical protein CM15mP49_20580 [Actinomycetota bacterium]
MEIIKLEGGLLSINFDETEKELLNDLTQDLLVKLGNEDPQALIPRLFPDAILNEPDLDSEYRAMTAHQLENSHRKALEALNLLTSEKEISLDDLILVIKGLNIIRLELGEELDIDDDSQSPPADDSNHYRLWIVFQYLGQILSQCIEEFERNF